MVTGVQTCALPIYKLNEMGKIIGVVSLFFFSYVTSAQAKDQISNLDRLCKVWGFVKYYHPTISKGIINWDSVFVEVFKKIDAVKEENAFEVEMYRLLLAAGKIGNKAQLPLRHATSSLRLIRLRWIDEFKNPEIKKFLHELAKNGNSSDLTELYFAYPRRYGDGRFAGYPTFREIAYEKMNYLPGNTGCCLCSEPGIL